MSIDKNQSKRVLPCARFHDRKHKLLKTRNKKEGMPCETRVTNQPPTPPQVFVLTWRYVSKPKCLQIESCWGGVGEEGANSFKNAPMPSPLTGDLITRQSLKAKYNQPKTRLYRFHDWLKIPPFPTSLSDAGSNL